MMRASRFWLALIAAFFAASFLWVVLFKLQAGRPTPMGRWVAEVYAAKQVRLTAVSPPRIVIVGGSSALFGLDSRALEAEWRRPVINFAVNAGLTLPYILHAARRMLKPGDIALLPLEYSLYQYDGVPNDQVIDYVVARDGDYWHSLSLLQRLGYVARMTPERLAMGLRRLPDNPVGAGTYGGHHIDSHGDQTHTDAELRSEHDRAAVAAAVNKPWDYGRRDNAAFPSWVLLRGFAAWASAQGICLIAMPPTLLAHARYWDDPVENAFYDGLPSRVRAIGIPFVGNPHDFMYPADRYFDTDYHLSAAARSDHTARVARLLGPEPAAHCRPAPT